MHIEKITSHIKSGWITLHPPYCDNHLLDRFPGVEEFPSAKKFVGPVEAYWYLTGHLGPNLFMVISNGLETPQEHFKTSNKFSGNIRARFSQRFSIFMIFMLFWTNFRNIWLIKIISTSLIHCVMISICSNIILRYFETAPPAHGNRVPDHKNRASAPWKLNV